MFPFDVSDLDTYFVFLQSLTDTADHVKNYRPKLIVLTGNPATRSHHHILSAQIYTRTSSLCITLHFFFCFVLFVQKSVTWESGLTPNLQAPTRWLCQSDHQETFASHLWPRHLGEIFFGYFCNWVKAPVTWSREMCRLCFTVSRWPDRFFTPISPILPNCSQIPEFGLRAAQQLILSRFRADIFPI